MTLLPTEDQFDEAHYYALGKLCERIGNDEYMKNLAHWDSQSKTCRLTERGCDSTLNGNPLSKPIFDASGNFVKYSPNNTRYGELWKYIQPRDLVWKKLDDGTMGCGFSNFLYKRYCLVPETRSTKSQRGVTNVKPFNFVMENGEETCKITKEYCDDKGISFSNNKGECVIPVGQKVGEFFSGTTMVRDIRSGRASDRRLKYDIKIYKPDYFEKGIHLYSFMWTEIAQHLYNKTKKRDIGFIADEFPEDKVFFDEYGYKNIKTEDDKRIKLFYKIKDILYNND